MELHERFSHHASKCLIVNDRQTDQWGNPILIEGQGFKHGRIYEQIDDRNGLVDHIWIESSSGQVLFEAKKKHTLDQVLYLRDTAFPDATVHHYHGQYQTHRRCDDPDWGSGYGAAGVTVYRPKSAARVKFTPSKSKKSKKIRRAWA